MTIPPIWAPQPETKVDANGICLMHGGPVGMRLPEHEHVEVQVEAHFTAGVFLPRGKVLDHEPSFIRVVPSGQPHIGQWNNHCEVVVLLLSQSLFHEAADELLRTSNCEVQGALYGSDPMIHSQSRVLRNQFKNGVANDLMFVESAAHKIVERLLRRFSARSGERTLKGRLMPWQFKLIVDLIESRLGDRIGVRELAAQLGIGPHQFTHHFRETTGMSPYQFMLERRIERARTLLAETHQTLAQIAHVLGFVSQSHFTASFHRLTGTTPGKFRLERRGFGSNRPPDISSGGRSTVQIESTLANQRSTNSGLKDEAVQPLRRHRVPTTACALWSSKADR